MQKWLSLYQKTSAQINFCRSSTCAVDWHGRVKVAIWVVPLLIAALLFEIVTLLVILGVTSLAVHEYRVLRYHILQSNCQESHEKKEKGATIHWGLWVMSLLFHTCCYLDSSPSPGPVFILATFMSLLFMTAAPLFTFIGLHTKDRIAQPLIIRSILQGALDLLFFFQYIWSLGFGIYARKLPCGLGISIFFLSCNFIGDTGALLSGNLFGKKQVMPIISSKKTYAGILGAFACSQTTAWLLFLFCDKFSLICIGKHNVLKDYLVLASLIACLGIAGDFIESAFKRATGVKESSQLLGAHGGILDRLDSLSISIPLVFMYIAHWMH